MTAFFRSASPRKRYTFAVATVAVIVVAGSVWAKGNGPQASIVPESARIDVATLHSRVDVARLPVLEVEQPF
jgi:hypothetical protein